MQSNALLLLFSAKQLEQYSENSLIFKNNIKLLHYLCANAALQKQ